MCKRPNKGNILSENIVNSNPMLRIGSWNVGTMKGRASEIVETLTRRRVDLCCVQESRLRGSSARLITGKDSKFKFFWNGNDEGTNGVGLLLAEMWIENVLEVIRISDRLMHLKLIVGNAIINVISCYAPQSGLSDNLKTAFYDEVFSVVSKINNSEYIAICGDFNGHVGHSTGYEGMHGGFGFGEQNDEVVRLLNFASANDLSICNTYFRKRESHLCTYQSGQVKSQIDFILLRYSNLHSVKD